jgi:hypothetical protein
MNCLSVFQLVVHSYLRLLTDDRGWAGFDDNDTDVESVPPHNDGPTLRKLRGLPAWAAPVLPSQ